MRDHTRSPRRNALRSPVVITPRLHQSLQQPDSPQIEISGDLRGDPSPPHCSRSPSLAKFTTEVLKERREKDRAPGASRLAQAGGPWRAGAEGKLHSHIL